MSSRYYRMTTEFFRSNVDPSAGEAVMQASKWSIGPLSIATVAVVVLIDLCAPAIVRGLIDEAVMVGLSFGQIGAAVVWASAMGLTWRRVAICYIVTLVMAFHFFAIEGGPNDLESIAFLLTIWCSCTTIALFVTFALAWLRHQNREDANDSHADAPPRFSVRHLLILTTVLASASLIVRTAIPEMEANGDLTTVVVWVLQSALLSVIASELVRLSPPIVAQLGSLGLSGIVASGIVLATIDWEEAVYANAVQIAILALAMVVPQLDRYKFRVLIESREPSDKQTQLPD